MKFRSLPKTSKRFLRARKASFKDIANDALRWGKVRAFVDFIRGGQFKARAAV